MAEGDTQVEQAEQTEGRKRVHYKGPLDIGSPEAEPAPTRGGIDLSLYKQHLQASWHDVQNKSETPSRGFTVPEAGAQLTETRFRQAAAELDLGVTVKVYKPGDPGSERYNLQPGQARVVICAKERMKKEAKPADQAASQQPVPASSGLTRPPAKK